MWPYDDLNPMEAYFRTARTTAANVPQPGEQGNYTEEIFQSDFPQFYMEYKLVEDPETYYKSLVPAGILQTFIAQANDSVLPSRWGSLWRYAAGLYVAHFSALYLKTYAPSSSSPSQAAANASQTGVVKTASMGDTSISYDNSAITVGTEKWGSWNATQYGSQLVTLARQVGMGGIWV